MMTASIENMELVSFIEHEYVRHVAATLLDSKDKQIEAMEKTI